MEKELVKRINQLEHIKHSRESGMDNLSKRNGKEEVFYSQFESGLGMLDLLTKFKDSNFRDTDTETR